MKECTYCGKLFTSDCACAGHISHCAENPNNRHKYEIKHNCQEQEKDSILKYRQYKYDTKTFSCNCVKCGRVYNISTTQQKYDNGEYRKTCSSFCSHSRTVSNITKTKISNSLKTSEKFNNSLLRSYKQYTCKWCNKLFTVADDRDTTGRLYCSAECRHNFLSKNTGGCRKGSGVGKSGWYKGFHCDSTWELAFLMYHIDNGLNIRRCTEARTYIYNGKLHRYYPDFVTDDGIVEIKGYISEQWEAKHRQNPDIIVLYKDDMTKYIDYAVKRYGEKLELNYTNNKNN